MHDISKMRQARKRQKLFRAAVRWMVVSTLFSLSWLGLYVLLAPYMMPRLAVFFSGMMLILAAKFLEEEA